MDINHLITDSTLKVLQEMGETVDVIGEKADIEFIVNQEINIIVTFETGIRGNIVFGLNEDMVNFLKAEIMGEYNKSMEDQESMDALGEIGSLIIGTILSEIKMKQKIKFSPPSVVIGKDLMLVMGNMIAQKIDLRGKNGILSITYCIW